MKEGMLRRSQFLRKNATKEENKLWYQFLRTYPIQWNRQKVIGGYIADFYCKRAGIVIELDGSQHYEKDHMEYDAVRTDYFRSMDLEVIRFSNTEIEHDFRAVCKAIDLAVNTRLR